MRRERPCSPFHADPEPTQFRQAIRFDGATKQALETGRTRLLFASLLFAVAFLIVAGRLVSVAMLSSSGEPSIAEAPRATQLETERADIVDRNGIVLATNLVGPILGMKVVGGRMLTARRGSIVNVSSTGGMVGMSMIGAYVASKWALEKAGWKPADLDLMEINEAFAAQACAVNKEMGWDTSRINVNGGAIALGHPIGASGCRVLVTLLHEMRRRNARKGLASLCIGGGMGVALAVER